MAAYGFNPVVQGETSIVTATKFEDGSGLIQIPFVDFENFQVLIRFEVR